MLRLILTPLRWALGILSALVVLIVLYGSVTFVQIWLTGRTHSSSSAQAILVFGTTEDNGVASPELRARLDEALQVFHAGRAPLVVVTGGSRPGDVYTEAEVSATYLEAHGVPKTRLIVGAGDDTWQNVQSVISKLRQRHIVSVISVTDPFHEDRAMAVSSSLGLRPVPSPVSNSPTSGSGLWLYYVKETLEVSVGRVVGYERLSEWTTGHHITLPSGG